jgi:hypothetical protein
LPLKIPHVNFGKESRWLVPSGAWSRNEIA